MQKEELVYQQIALGWAWTARYMVSYVSYREHRGVQLGHTVITMTQRLAGQHSVTKA